jgi:hypothetical protein
MHIHPIPQNMKTTKTPSDHPETESKPRPSSSQAMKIILAGLTFAWRHAPSIP